MIKENSLLIARFCIEDNRLEKIAFDVNKQINFNVFISIVKFILSDF